MGRFATVTMLVFLLMGGCAGRNLKLLPPGELPVLETGILSPPEAFATKGGETGDRDLYELLESLRMLISMTEKKDLAHLPTMISKKEGVFIDLKAHVSYDQLVKEVAKPDGYFQNFYFDTDRLRKRTGDETQISVRDLLLSTRRIRVDLFKDPGGKRCEMKLHLLDHPELDFRLNNPVFIKEGGAWKVYALF